MTGAMEKLLGGRAVCQACTSASLVPFWDKIQIKELELTVGKISGYIAAA